MRTTHQVSIYVEVSHRQALYKAALARAMADGLDKKDAESNLKSFGSIDVHKCLIMLFDPGTSPDGCKILDTAVE